jgi:COMPASS component SWD3
VLALTALTAAADKTVCIWDVASNTKAKELKGHTQGISDVEWCEQTYVATASDDKTVKLWDIETVCRTAPQFSVLCA